MKRIEVKITEFTELEKILNKEREDLQRMRESNRKSHIKNRKEIEKIVVKVKKICEKTGKDFDSLFF